MITYEKEEDSQDCMEIEIELRDRMVSHIKNSIIDNLEAIKKFLQIPGSEYVCAGLYTYAVEEYGKSLYLKSFCSSPANSNIIKFPYKMKGRKKGNTGFLNHYRKFELALDVLPYTCKLLNTEGSFTDRSFKSKSFTKDLIADFEARKAIFFADFTEDRKSIKMPPKVERALLEKAVDSFLDFMKK